jgi:hypothetical protein
VCGFDGRFANVRGGRVWGRKGAIVIAIALFGMPVIFGCLRSVAPEEPFQRRFVGLKNQGSTCHLNVVLQSLYMTPDFRTDLLNIGSSSELPPTVRAVHTVFSRMAQQSRTVSTKPLTNAVKPFYDCTHQQDCHDTWLMVCAATQKPA